LIAGTNTGYVYTLDSGTQDDSSDIAVYILTGVDDNDQPYVPKNSFMHRIRIDTGGDTATVSLYLDGSATVSKTISVNESV